MANTHYAVTVFGGDPAAEHGDPKLRGRGPTMSVIACGPEDFCFEFLDRWTRAHPLRRWESAEILARDPSVIANELAWGVDSDGT